MHWVAIWPFLLPVMVVVVIFAYLVVVRYMRHKEYLAMIEKGIDPHTHPERQQESAPVPDGSPAPRRRLMGGTVTAAVGLALTLGLLTLGIGPWLLGGLVPLFIGLAILFVRFLFDEGQ